MQAHTNTHMHAPFDTLANFPEVHDVFLNTFGVLAEYVLGITQGLFCLIDIIFIVQPNAEPAAAYSFDSAQSEISRQDVCMYMSACVTYGVNISAYRHHSISSGIRFAAVAGFGVSRDIS